MTLQITPYFLMPGNANEAIEFYRNVLGAELVEKQTYADAGIPCQDAIKEHIAHALLKVDDSVLQFSDSPTIPTEPGSLLNLSITSPDVEKTNQVFAQLEDGGTVRHALEKTAFSPAFGTVTDRFGVTFTIMTLP
ncbi:VOC family protein [Aureibacillus halotolerans]|uniref:PhnB protein n=1 Tax=Aureibacillus halotolerans TaxID=1508390 RepID=A0A4R6TWA6_9BACI|nr:VOC family protein [Aureibacillus halotolerans]TDQ37731.1 PhnB protein [Aureibacillus halotolerans]